MTAVFFFLFIALSLGITYVAARRTHSTLGSPTASAVFFFLVIVALTLAVTYWAARRTKTTSEFYAAGRSISPLQNGLALAGDYMSAASFLGIAGLVSLSGFDGLIYSRGFLVGWPVVMFLIAEPLRNLGKFTFADVVAFRLRQVPVRIAAAIGSILTLLFYVPGLIHALFVVNNHYADKRQERFLRDLNQGR